MRSTVPIGKIEKHSKRVAMRPMKKKKNNTKCKMRSNAPIGKIEKHSKCVAMCLLGKILEMQNAQQCGHRKN